MIGKTKIAAVVLAAVAVLAAGCGSSTVGQSTQPKSPASPAEKTNDAPTWPSRTTPPPGWAVLDESSVAGLFPAMDGVEWWGIVPVDRLYRDLWVFYPVFKDHVRGGHVADAELMGEWKGDVQPGLAEVQVVLLALAPAYSSPEAARAELSHLGRMAAASQERAAETTISGHRAVTWAANGSLFWCWVSGKTMVIVAASEQDQPYPEQFVRAYAAHIP